MAILTPTKDEGATAKPSAVVYVDPTAQVDDDALAAQMSVGDLNAPFLADLLSAFLAHERCGRHLYRSVAGRTKNPMLKRKYEEFGSETEQHVAILAETVAAMGGNPNYVSPAARATEKADVGLIESTFLLEGSGDLMTAELVMVEAVMLAEAKDHANWQTLGKLAEDVPKGPVRDALDKATAQVLPQEDEHLQWACETRARVVLLQAKSPMASSVAGKAEEMVAKIQDWLK